jgi:iron complex outermembrane receptor protein
LALASVLPTVAVAQTQTPPSGADAAPTEVEEIVVTGLRRGLADSISIKRRETSIVEAVSAEDIGKLPDVSIAESIARLPGLAAQRVNGRAQVISIRGLAPDFTTTLLNGRQQASSGDNRAVEFDQYPSELLSGVVIYKTPDAEVSGMGLSGTADLRTVRPLTFGDRAVAVERLSGALALRRTLDDDDAGVAELLVRLARLDLADGRADDARARWREAMGILLRGASAAAPLPDQQLWGCQPRAVRAGSPPRWPPLLWKSPQT